MMAPFVIRNGRFVKSGRGSEQEQTLIDALAVDGKLYPDLKAIAEDTEFLSHPSRIISKAREVGIKVFFVPHHHEILSEYERFLPTDLGPTSLLVRTTTSFLAERVQFRIANIQASACTLLKNKRSRQGCDDVLFRTV